MDDDDATAAGVAAAAANDDANDYKNCQAHKDDDNLLYLHSTVPIRPQERFTLMGNVVPAPFKQMSDG
jgi:hypothetical protein